MYNKRWNFFAGKSQNEIYEYQKNDIFEGKPTKPFSKVENCLTFSMSGSGPTCFALFKDIETAKKELTANYKLIRNKGYDSWVCTFLEKGITFI